MAGKKKAGVKSLEFATPAFLHHGKEYVSAEFEKEIEAGNEEYVALVPELIKLGQIVEVETTPTEE
jgi:hypothetical protein